MYYRTRQTSVGASNQIQTTGGGGYESIVEVNGGSCGDVGSHRGDVVGGGRPVDWLGGWLARLWPVPDWIFSGQNGKLTFSAHVARRGHPYRGTGRSLLTTGRQPLEPASLFPAMLQFPLTCIPSSCAQSQPQSQPPYAQPQPPCAQSQPPCAQSQPQVATQPPGCAAIAARNEDFFKRTNLFEV